MPSLRKRWATDEVEGVLVPTVLVGTPCSGSNAGSLPLVDLCWGHCWRGGRRASSALARRRWEAGLSCCWVSAAFGYQAPSGPFIAPGALYKLVAAELHLGW